MSKLPCYIFFLYLLFSLSLFLSFFSSPYPLAHLRASTLLCSLYTSLARGGRMWLRREEEEEGARWAAPAEGMAGILGSSPPPAGEQARRWILGSSPPPRALPLVPPRAGRPTAPPSGGLYPRVLRRPVPVPHRDVPCPHLLPPVSTHACSS